MPRYEIWCSTDHGNKRLDSAWKERQGKGAIYLFFSVNGSGHFCGIAQMLTDVNYTTAGESVWVQDKFKGQFKVRWVYVKDVPNGQLRHIRLENNENKPVTNSRDTQEVPPEKGRQVLKIIHTYKHQASTYSFNFTSINTCEMPCPDNFLLGFCFFGSMWVGSGTLMLISYSYHCPLTKKCKIPLSHICHI